MLGAWIVLLVASAPLALRQFDHLTEGGWGAGGSESHAVEETLAGSFASSQRAHLSAMLTASSDSGASALRAAVRRLERAAEGTAHVELGDAARRQSLVDSKRGGTLIVPLEVDVGEDATSDVVVQLRERLTAEEGPRAVVQTDLLGQGAIWTALSEQSRKDVEAAHRVALPVVLGVLLAVFGSFWAATLPLAVGIASIVVAGGLIYLLSQSLAVSVFAPGMAVMIGVAVAVDYSLFVLARYRQEIRAGARPASARSTTIATSGIAIVVSGLAVVISLVGLWIVPVQGIRSAALSMIIVVAVSVLAASTLLPALLDLLGRRAYGPGRVEMLVKGILGRTPSLAPRRVRVDAQGPGPIWARWAELAMRRPAVSVLAALIVLLALALPTLDIRAGLDARTALPKDNDARVASERAAAIEGPGEIAPVQVIARFRVGRLGEPRNRAALAELRRELASLPGLRRPIKVDASEDGRSALLAASPKDHANSDAATASIRRLRDELPASVGGPIAQLQLGGATARVIDLVDLVTSSLWKVMLLIVALCSVVLLVLLRSVALSLLTALMTLLSVGAAYGVMVAVFQWGWFEGFSGLEPTGYLWAPILPLAFALVFGLSMDYSVFLLSRIQERFEATGDPRRAVADGLACSAHVIASAALIMVAIFLVFVATGVPVMKQLGVGLSVAVAIEATLVRLVLAPATIAMLGHRSWWMPAPMSRVLPSSSFERTSS